MSKVFSVLRLLPFVIVIALVFGISGYATPAAQPMGDPFKTTPKDLPVIKLPDDLANEPLRAAGNPHGGPPGKDKPKPPPDDDSVTNKWAVVIGISKYKAGGSLWNPANDAKEMKEALISTYGFSEDRIKLLLDRNATARAISKAIDWLVNNEDAESSVVFFFSGHGYRAPDSDNWDADVEIDGNDELIVSYDNYGLPDGWLKSKLSALESQKVALAFGSCYSGGMFDDTNADLQGSGRVVASACKADELAWDYLLLRNTLWGYYFVDEGILGALADLNEDGASIEEAHAYAKGKVITIRSDMHPQMSDNYDPQLIP